PEVVSALPTPLLDHDDVGAALLQGYSYTEPQEALETLRQAMQAVEYEKSAEIPFGVVRSMLDLGYTGQAKQWLDKLEQRLGQDWRYQWYSGVTQLLLEDYQAAQLHFSNMLEILPGESAPKLALAAVNELLLQSLGYSEQQLLEPPVARACANITSNLFELDESYFEDPTIWEHVTTDPSSIIRQRSCTFPICWRFCPVNLRQSLRSRPSMSCCFSLWAIPNSSFWNRRWPAPVRTSPRTSLSSTSPILKTPPSGNTSPPT